MQEMWVGFLGWEDSLKKEMATHFVFCLENPMDRGAWKAAVHGFTKSRTPLSDQAHTHEVIRVDPNCV